jgi:hypothetical protein
MLFSDNFKIEYDDKERYKLFNNFRIFIDRDGKYFRYILNFLRSGGFLIFYKRRLYALYNFLVTSCVFPIENENAIKEIIVEAKFYNLITLIDHFSGNYNHFSSKSTNVILSDDNKTGNFNK